MYTAPGFAKYMEYDARTSKLFIDDPIVCNKLEARERDEVIVEEGYIIYEQSNRQDDGLIPANISFKNPP
jgi:hypothetical protein